MRGVAEVFEVEFPVAVVSMLEDAAGDFDLAVRRAVDHVVERRGHVAEPALQARSFGRLIDENEAAIARHPRDGQHGHRSILRIEIRRIAVLERYRLQSPIKVIGPTVIAALKFAGAALVGGDHQRAPMSALIVQNVHRLVGTAHNDDRLASDLRAKVIAGFLDLAFVTDIDPRGTEDALELKLENRRIVVEATMDGRRPYQ